jgi:hypothetical protein
LFFDKGSGCGRVYPKNISHHTFYGNKEKADEESSEEGGKEDGKEDRKEGCQEDCKAKKVMTAGEVRHLRIKLIA